MCFWVGSLNAMNLKNSSKNIQKRMPLVEMVHVVSGSGTFLKKPPIFKQGQIFFKVPGKPVPALVTLYPRMTLEQIKSDLYDKGDYPSLISPEYQEITALDTQGRKLVINNLRDFYKIPSSRSAYFYALTVCDRRYKKDCE